MSYASLADDSVVDMLLNHVRHTPLKMALRAFQLLDDFLSSLVDNSSSLLGTAFLGSSSLVGGDQPVRIAFHASSSMDLMNSRIRAFH